MGGSFYSILRVQRFLKQATALCTTVAGGNFHERLVGIREGGEVDEVAHAINDLIDRADAFIRETVATIDCVLANKYYRRVIETGLRGAFLNSSRSI